MVAAVSCKALDGGLVGRDCAANASRTRSAITAASLSSAPRIECWLAFGSATAAASTALDRCAPAREKGRDERVLLGRIDGERRERQRDGKREVVTLRT